MSAVIPHGHSHVVAASRTEPADVPAPVTPAVPAFPGRTEARTACGGFARFGIALGGRRATAEEALKVLTDFVPIMQLAADRDPAYQPAVDAAKTLEPMIESPERYGSNPLKAGQPYLDVIADACARAG